MTYQETLEYLYSRLPVFQNIGARAFKPGLFTTQELCKSLGNPEKAYPIIHVGGTNGKGSTSHMLAAILQQSGYKVGLYTSPHLKDFRERIRINGAPITEEFVVEFTNDIESNIDRLDPSFFEVTVAMAFSYFRDHQVDIAVVEVGMGGRLDSTNVITPILSVITNVSLDHTQFLGNTLPEIAAEKAGIIKEKVPVVISEYQEENIANVFINKASSLEAPITFGSQQYLTESIWVDDGKMIVNAERLGSEITEREDLRLDLTGSYQLRNLAGVLTARDVLKSEGWNIPPEAVRAALSQVVPLTGLKGRWQKIGDQPLVVCDTAHNVGGLSETIAQFTSLPHKNLRFVIGFVKDKDISAILKLLPLEAVYYFCQPGNLRALDASELAFAALEHGLQGEVFLDVNVALKQAVNDSDPTDIIYVGGSTFIVADLDQL
ncbi:Folylpolyglutamate synthase [Dyadobacter sp. CECT 9623]|uniref:Dihydrofolate synthase/folylpolyglutamate synthase n=1 Tax=Dyadobacter linearis TaxID=2823330 RepID=A0ABM8UNU0_9BACT|nr:folylpolyglutamate synthase/dihydrofolate synthase family protein [Dyadobacter sp. CECT 9623]CAG5069119.1 Folylpolyglutamate synthase [Dyadobacter sp. CECT 9623]